jgi:hypothetical protein
MSKPTPVSLAQQIEEVEYELKQRANVYANIARRVPHRQSELDFHVARLQAVLATLRWLETHNDEIRAWVKAR